MGTDECAALVIAHPGHELRIHHWLELARPLVLVLTDGSGHGTRARIDSTSAVLDRAGARRGSVYGVLSDRRLYGAILAGEHALFLHLADEIAATLRREGITCVVGDAVEGFNPGHDVCRLLLNAALLRLEQTGGGQMRNMEFLLEGPPGECPADDRDDAIILALDEEAYRRKIAAARSYPEMAMEVERALSSYDADMFRQECIRPVRYTLDIQHKFAHPCFYEQYGEKRVAAGIYKNVIRFREHIAPLAAALES